MEIKRLKPIESEMEYRALLAECEVLAGTDPDPDSPDGRRLIKLAVAIEEWERVHYPVREAKDAERK